MLQEVDEILNVCRQWAEREEEVTVVEALTLLTEFYMKQCDISLTQCALAYECGEYWLYKLSLSDHTLAEKAGIFPFTFLMPYFSESFARNKQHYWGYELHEVDENSMIAGMTEIMTDECLDDKLRIAFACGFIQYYTEYKEFERTFNAWIKLQDKTDGNEN